MQVSVSSAAASAVSGAAGSVSGAAGKTEHTTNTNPQTGSSDNASFEQAYTQAGTSTSALETASSGDQSVSGEQSVPGDLLPSDTPALEQLAQWLQAQPDPAQALETMMQQLGLSAGQQGELTQALAAALRRQETGMNAIANLASSPQVLSMRGGNLSLSMTTHALTADALGHSVSHSASQLNSVAQDGLTLVSDMKALSVDGRPAPTAALLEALQQLMQGAGHGAMQGAGQGVAMHNLQALAQQQMQQAASSSAAQSANLTDVATQHLQASVDVTSPEWGKDLVEQLRARMSLTKQDGLQKAYIRLDPPELGKLEVSIRVDGDKASVHFGAAHPQLREALAANAERLRLDFDGSALDLVDVSVSSGLSQQGQDDTQTQQDEHAIAANDVRPARASMPAYALSARFAASPFESIV